MSARRAPSPLAVLRDLRRDLDSGWPAGLTVLTGDDAYHMDLAQRALLDALAPAGDGGGFGLTMYGPDGRVPVSTAVGAVRSVGMFSPRRVVLVRGATTLEGDPDALVDYARRPPANSFLLVRAPALDRRRKLHQALARSGRTLTFDASVLAGGALEREVRALAAQRGVTLDRAALGLLAEICGPDFYRITGELDKLAAWAAAEGDTAIDERAVREVGAGSGLLGGWEIADAVLARDRRAALEAVERVVAAGDEPLKLIGGLAWRARLMLQARAMIAAGATPTQAVSRVPMFGVGEPAFLAGLRRYSLEELLAFPALLLKADRSVKSSSLDAAAVLHRLVDELTGEPAATGGAAR